MSEPGQKVEIVLIVSKLYINSVNCFKNGLSLLSQLRGKPRFSRLPPKKFYFIN